MIFDQKEYFSSVFSADHLLFGYPVRHSISPELQEMLFSLNELDYSYVSVEMPPEQIDDAIEAARTKVRGFNCTIPHKTAVLAHLDDISDLARDMGSVNTVKCENGRLLGYNTDILGFSETLKLDGIDLAGKDVLILGYGGVSRMMAYHAVGENAKVTIAGRDTAKGQVLADELSGRFGVTIEVTTLDTVSGHYDIVCNGTPVGMWPHGGVSPLDLERLQGVTYVFDTIYNPSRTALLLQAEDLGIQCRNGMAMLVLQAAYAQTIWVGATFTDEQKKRAIDRAEGLLARRRLWDNRKKKNIVLTGYMGTGKSTVGKLLAADLGMDFVDMDEVIVEKCGMSINDIFALHGEGYFREVETAVCRELAARENAVIATGGGVVVTPENIPILRQSGVVVCLMPPDDFWMANVKKDTSRPLLRDDPDLSRAKVRLMDRTPKYLDSADIVIPDAGEAKDRAMKIELSL